MPASLKRKPLPKKKKIYRKAPRTISEQQGHNILVEHHEQGIPIRIIAATYDVSERTVYNYLKQHEYKPDDLDKFNPLDVLSRVDMDPISRLKLLTQDAGQLLELTLAAMLYKVRANLYAAGNNVIDKTATLDTKELIQIIEKVTPYVLPKSDAPGSKKAGEKDKTPRGKAHDMFMKKSV